MKVFKKIIKYLVIVLILGGLGVGGYYGYNYYMSSKAKPTSRDIVAMATKRDINVTITGTGTVAPISRYEIAPLVKGNILQCPFNEGDKVKKGDLLYRIDDSDLSFNIQKSQDNIEKLRIGSQDTETSLNSLEVFAPIDGRVSNLTVKEDEQVGSNGKVADITDDKNIVAKVPFLKSQAEMVHVGEDAQLQNPSDWATMDGKITAVSNSASYTTDGASVYNVEITARNVGVTTGTAVNGILNISGKKITSFYTGTIDYAKQQSALTKTAGKVSKVYVKNGDWVKAGDKILELTNDSLVNTKSKNELDLKDSQISLDAQKKQLNDYSILSPIDGTIISKTFKKGDTINDVKTLMVVADLSKMVFTIDVDELDVSKISVGQKVTITSDALTGSTFTGVITNIPVEGKTTNGVTTYAVQVTISDPKNLKPGMNVNAEILVQSKKDVLAVPAAAVTKIGGKAYVNVPASGGGNRQSGQSNQSGQNGQNWQNRQNGQNGQDGQAAQGGQSGQNRQQGGQNGQNGQYRQNGQSGQAGQYRQSGQNRQSTGSVSYQRKEVTVGVNDENFIEILSGLNEGDRVVIPNISTSTSGNNNRNNMMGGGGFGGGGFGGGGFSAPGGPGGGQRPQGR